MVDDAAQVVVAFDIAQRVVTVAADFLHLLYGIAEDKAVVGTDFFQNFNVRAVQRTHAECAVEGEFHVAGTRCFGTSKGNLLVQVGGRNDDFGKAHAVIGNVNDFN